ncbi:hypothetical protein C8J57DRAFT_1211387 [Mycena rebaudengoi]|nr:hypothetical protein C8J57DRAFT_1211387 [Mycena rebaudengoi]
MLALPPPKEHLDGMTDDMALILPEQLSVNECETFFMFVFNTKGWLIELPPIEDLCALLKTCHFFEVQNRLEYAVFCLEKYGDLGQFKPALQFHLGCDYSITNWVSNVFDESKMQHFLGGGAFAVLAKTQAQIMDHRLTLAIMPPEVSHALGCYNHYQCQSQWEDAWTSIPCGVAGWLLRDELSGAEILEKLNSFSAGTMTGECLRSTCDSVQEKPDKKSMLKKEEEMIDEVRSLECMFVATIY